VTTGFVPPGGVPSKGLAAADTPTAPDRSFFTLTDGTDIGNIYFNSSVLTISSTDDIKLYPTGDMVEVQGHLYPQAHDTFDLGESAAGRSWRSGFINSLNSEILTMLAGGYVDFSASNYFTVPRLAADPGVFGNGNIYYNTATNKMRVSENGAWRDM
jgi:hypothetical protein